MPSTFNHWHLIPGVHQWDVARWIKVNLKGAKIFQQPYHQQAPALARLEASPPPWAHLSAIDILSRLAAGAAEIEARRAMALIATRLRLYELEHGDLPATLDVLGELPDDPGTGKPFEYEVQDDGFVLHIALPVLRDPVQWRWPRIDSIK